MGQTRLLAWTGLAVIAAAALWHNVPMLSPGLFDWAEPGNVAAALAEGRGFSDPFDGGTGPTAWVSPLPVWVEAAVFLALGVKTAASAKAMLVLAVLGLAGANALLASALAPYGAWMRLAASAAFLAACALLPGGPLEILSEAWLDLLLSAALFWAVLETSRVGSTRGAAALAGVAFAAPLENAGLTVSVGLVIMALAWIRRGDLRRLAVPAAAAALAAVSVGCWTARNALVLHRLVPLKSNSWFELHLANVDSPDGLPRMETVLRRLPYFDAGEFNRYAGLGEMAYVESFRAPALASLRSDPLHFAGNVMRRLGAAVVFCKREGGGRPTSFAFSPADAARLSAAGELIAMGPGRALWTRIDAPPSAEYRTLHTLGLRDAQGVWLDWMEKRLAFDAEFRGPAGLSLGFLTAGVPLIALLLSAVLLGGRLAPPAAWAAAIAAGMLLPFVLVNHNERHQLPLVAMQAVAIGALAQAARMRFRPGSP
ncbi:MAG: hypothetical protein ABSF76_05310 [Opitutaceae bacterium]